MSGLIGGQTLKEYNYPMEKSMRKYSKYRNILLHFPQFSIWKY